jgi:energy-coupling factor transporter ATP-binding protein EcfA2
MSKIVAFCGSKGSGKSTSATLFKEVFPGEVEEIAIAGHLKTACAQVFGVDHNKFIDPSLKEVELEDYLVLDRAGIENLLKAFLVENIEYDAHVRPHLGKVIRTPRQLLQYIGTEVLHPIDPLVHVKVAMAKRNPDMVCLITDLRFKAEFEYFKREHEADFFPVYVKNPAAEIAASVDAHPSERQYESFVPKCTVLSNEGTLAELKAKLQEMANDVTFAVLTRGIDTPA